MAGIVPLVTEGMVYPVLCACIANGRSPDWHDLRTVALRIARESSVDDHAWTTAERRRLIRFARVAAGGARQPSP